MQQKEVSGDLFVESWFYKSNFTMYNLHSHEHYEIYYLISGKRKYLIDNKIFEVYPGDLILIKPRVLHMTMPLNSEPHERIVFNITDKILDRFPKFKESFKDLFNVNLIRTDENTSALFKELLEKINKEYNNKDAFSNDLLLNYTFELLSTIYRAKNNFNLTDNAPKTYDDKIDIALKYIYNNFTNKITLEELSNLCHLNPSYFSRLFKKSTGINVIQFLNTLRIREASKLLCKTNLSILEISLKCGFDSPQRFCDIFKKQMGVSAGVYRANAKKAEEN